MSSRLSPDLFKFVHDFAKEVADGKITKFETVEESSPIIAFCESFFEQFFGDELDTQITVFDHDAKRAAAEEAERLKLRGGNADDTKDARRLIALFEKFCDLYADVVGGTYGAGSITYRRFHADYMRRLLRAALAWARERKRRDLVAAIESASSAYDAALQGRGW
jgi:hypothetical protein